MSTIQQVGDKVLANVERVIVGKHHEVRLALVALHVPRPPAHRGRARAPARPCSPRRSRAASAAPSGGSSSRRTCCPSDVTGLSIYNQKTQEFEFRHGPIMSQIVLADEINRATPKTQSALLECMEERQVTVDGVTYPMPDPFLVIATQNPIEYEGTFALPEAQLDRFMLRIRMGYPAPLEEMLILDEQKRAHPLETLLGRLLAWRSCSRCRRACARSTWTRRSPTTSSRSSTPTRIHPDVYLGASPARLDRALPGRPGVRGLPGRDYVIPDDVKVLAEPALAHRRDHQDLGVDPRRRPRRVVREVLDATPSRCRAAAGGPGEVRARRRAADRAPRRARPRRSRRHAPPGPAPARRGRAAWWPRSRRARTSCSSCVYLGLLVARRQLLAHPRSGSPASRRASRSTGRRRRSARQLRARYTLRNRAGCPSCGWRSTARRRCPTRLPGGRSRWVARQRALVARRGRPADAPRPLPDRPAADPHRRPVRPLHGDRRGGRTGITVVVYPRVDAAAAAGACHRRSSRAATPRPSGPCRRRRSSRASGRMHRGRVQPHPLEVVGAPDGAPGQGVRPRADRRPLAVPGPRCRRRSRRGRRVDDGGHGPRRCLDRREGDRREPGRRLHRQRPSASPCCRRTGARASA